MLEGMAEELHPIGRYAVVALFTAVDVGVTFRRVDWPAHVTLASNFVTDASADDVEQVVRSGVAVSHAPRFEFGATAHFGPNRDMPVRLVVPGRAEELHDELAHGLERLPGFVADEPTFWRGGYRPHLTYGRAVSQEQFVQGDTHTARCIAIARLDRQDATITAVIDLPFGGT